MLSMRKELTYTIHISHQRVTATFQFVCLTFIYQFVWKKNVTFLFWFDNATDFSDTKLKTFWYILLIFNLKAQNLEVFLTVLNSVSKSKQKINWNRERVVNPYIKLLTCPIWPKLNGLMICLLISSSHHDSYKFNSFKIWDARLYL